MFDTETIDKLFLELSQFTQAKTKRELELQETIAKLEARIDKLNEELTEFREKYWDAEYSTKIAAR